ncbi:MAG: DUF819 family protein [Salibacteraceae bacterium]|nr:DUF819 family protein [Salibacteraceae bacterium]MDP4965502.1 DUF819 family protein [Salibacteraceae bacterium]
MVHVHEPFITSDAVTFGLLISLLALIFYTSSLAQFKRFYSIIPGLLLCYFLPSVFTSLDIIAAKWYDLSAVAAYLSALGANVPTDFTANDLNEIIAQMGVTKDDLSDFVMSSKLYYVASRYLLPSSLVLLTLSISMKELVKLGWKAIAMFLTGTIGVIIGGPIAIWVFSFIAPDVVGGVAPNEVWRGMTTIAGSWIGGGANQAAMFEVFGEGDKHLISGGLYSKMITVDIIVAEVWMAVLLFMIGKSEKIDNFLNADNTAVLDLKNKMHEFSQKVARIPSSTDLYVILAICFGATGLSHFAADFLAPFIKENLPSLSKFSLDSQFFWLIVIATTIGLVMSFTKARNYEGAGASKIGSVFIYILVATIGMQMNVMEVFEDPAIFLVGLVWMAIHVSLLFIVAKLIRAPFFFLAVGSKANIGGAASAPVVAAAFHPSLAPVGVLLAVLGYALGTYGALICGYLMQVVAP